MVRFEVPGTPGSFRSEVALPWEEGLQERWYGQRVALDRVPADPQGYIVLQWHAVMGGEKVSRNFPNVSISVKNDRWVVRQSSGTPQSIQRTTTEIGVAAQGKWTDVVVHAKWSTGEDGRTRIWLDGKLAYDVRGPNSYAGIRPRTPYYKTGIYRPSRRGATTSEPPTRVHVADVRIGRHDATYADVAPRRPRIPAGAYVFNASLANANGAPMQGGCLIVGNNGTAQFPSLYHWGRGPRETCGFPADKRELLANRQAVWDIRPITSTSGKTAYAIRSRVNGACLMRGHNGTAGRADIYLWGDIADKQFCGLRSADAFVENGQAAWQLADLQPIARDAGPSWFGALRLERPTASTLGFSPWPWLWPNPVPDYAFNAIHPQGTPNPWWFEAIRVGD